MRVNALVRAQSYRKYGKRKQLEQNAKQLLIVRISFLFVFLVITIIICVVNITKDNFAFVVIKMIVSSGHVDGPTEFVSLRFRVDLLDGHIPLLAPENQPTFVSAATRQPICLPCYTDTRIEIVQFRCAERDVFILFTIERLDFQFFQGFVRTLEFLLHLFHFSS